MNDPVRPEESWTEDDFAIPPTYAAVCRSAAELYGEMAWDEEADPDDFTVHYHRAMTVRLQALADLLESDPASLHEFLRQLTTSLPVDPPYV